MLHPIKMVILEDNVQYIILQLLHKWIDDGYYVALVSEAHSFENYILSHFCYIESI